MIQYKNFSNTYSVRKLDTSDLDVVYKLCLSNPLYYQKMHSEITLDSVRCDMTNFPQNKTVDDKYFLGYFKDQCLIAIMDLILDYPQNGTLWIGLFMVDHSLQHAGVGGKIIQELLTYLPTTTFSKVQLGYVAANEQSKSFWEKQGFVPTGKVKNSERYQIVIMEKVVY